MSFYRLFLRDCVYYRNTFAALFATYCLVCAVLTAALLTGDSVRGTLYDGVNRNAAFARTVIRFPTPVAVPAAEDIPDAADVLGAADVPSAADVPGAVLHTEGFIDPGIKTHLYAIADSGIKNRDAYCSDALAEKLKLKIGELFTVRLITVSAIPGESVMGMPPQLKQLRLVYRGVWSDHRSGVNFQSPQLRENNLFVAPELLAESLGLKNGVVNEIWVPDGKPLPVISDTILWELSQLELERWQGRPVLKSKAFYLPDYVLEHFPDAAKGLTLFAESLKGDKETLDYFFVGAFEGDVCPVEKDRMLVSDSVEERFQSRAVLTTFTTDAFRKITRRSRTISNVGKTDDSRITSVLTPEIPGLTDMSDCTDWETGVPIDFDRIRTADIAYWEKYKSKPKAYLNFSQAQEWFAPGKCNVLIFDADTDAASLREKITDVLRRNPGLYHVDAIADSMRAEIAGGVPFAALFLGLSCFIIVAALLVSSMLLKLHLFDRSEEMRIIAEHTAGRRTAFWFPLAEMLAVSLPGMIAGLAVGTLLCRFQLFLLERAWNGIILMNRIEYHANRETYPIAFGATFCCVFFVSVFALRSGRAAHRSFRGRSSPPRSFAMLGTRSFFRRFREYRVCMILLTMGFLATLGVGAFGIKSRGEDAFSYGYVAETALPVIPSHEQPFPTGGFPVRVKIADAADCSNILRAASPTVYGCDLASLTGDPNFLEPGQAAADAGSLQWIMKKRIGDTIAYPNGSLTLGHAMKASVFQRGVLTDLETFERLFPEVRGTRFFLIRDGKSEEIWRQYLEPYGVTISTTDAFMSVAESFQNRYLMIFLQLGSLGFVLGLGSLLLLVIRNLHARRNELEFMETLGFSRRSLLVSFFAENLWVHLSSALFSLSVLCSLALVARLDLTTLLVGWGVLTGLGVLSIFLTLHFYFQRRMFRSAVESSPTSASFG